MTDNTKECIATNLIRIRRFAHKRLKDVEDATGIKVQTLCAYEHGRKTPTIENLCKIADFYGITVDFFVNDYFCQSPNASDFAVLEYFLSFIKYSDSTIEFDGSKIILNCKEKYTDILSKLDIDIWLKNGFLKIPAKNNSLSNRVIEHMLIKAIYDGEFYE